MRAGITVGAVGALVTGLLWWGTADLGAGHDPDNRASALVPPDGHRTLEKDDHGTVEVSEDARLTGAELVVTSPPEVGGALKTLLGGDVAHWRIWRNVTTSYGATAKEPEQTTTVRRLTDQGIEQLADYGAFTLVFNPPLLEVPADVHDGSTWSGTGDARANGEISYASHLQAADAGHDAGHAGCLRITGDIDLHELGQELDDLAVDESWCPGEGVTGEQVTAEPPAFAGSTTPVPVDASAADVAGWQVRPRPAVFADSVASARRTGDIPSLAYDEAPVATADAGLVVANTPGRDLLGFTPADGALVRAWVGHPGGTVTALGASGAVTVAASTTRDVDGYGPFGAWLWSRRLSDVMVTAPVAVDADHLVLTSLAGEVVVVDPATGRKRWAAGMTDQVRAAPAGDADHVVAGDVAGQVSLFDTTSGRRRWTVEGGAVQAVGIVGSTVVVLANQSVVGYRVSDGRRLWVRSIDGVLDGAVVDLGSAVAVATGDQTLGLDPATGAVRWSTGGADDTVGTGAAVVQVDGDQLVARDATGQVLGRWTLEGLHGALALTPVADGLYATDARGQSVAVSP